MDFGKPVDVCGSGIIAHNVIKDNIITVLIFSRVDFYIILIVGMPRKDRNDIVRVTGNGFRVSKYTPSAENV